MELFNKKKVALKGDLLIFILKNHPAYCWMGKLSGKPVTPLYLKSSMISLTPFCDFFNELFHKSNATTYEFHQRLHFPDFFRQTDQPIVVDDERLQGKVTDRGGQVAQLVPAERNWKKNNLKKAPFPGIFLSYRQRSKTSALSNFVLAFLALFSSFEITYILFKYRWKITPSVKSTITSVNNIVHWPFLD